MTKETKKGLTRRAVLAAGASIPLVSILSKRGDAAEFTLKFATGQDPSHPVNKRALEAIDRIKQATGGRVEINLFPANQLGSDIDLLGQIRNGAVDFLNIGASVLATRIPTVGIVNTGFAFASYDDVWKAMDGDLGKFVKAEIENTGTLQVCKSWDNGFRQLTSSTREIKTPDDLKGFKMRVPPAPILTNLFQALGAGPTPINFNEVYSALQTKIVEGQENPLAIIATAKLYEVQKYCSLTSHVWDAYIVLGNPRTFSRFSTDVQEIVTRELNKAGEDERADIAALSKSLRSDLTAKGLNFVEVDQAVFRSALAKTKFYSDWHAKFGEKGWTILEQAVGKLG
ncbi:MULTISPECIES: TRAP transporter substrate-binding protein [unclassified Bradyrhizobium]|uniref:TRAP transporter substrate-binding protein n=1 Tax=unclassified Bradyrhizobium TaxID=2631580 RepID=UPI0004138235|nr:MULTISPECIES: TRAP transporter substrate-binding protein [unclassified Bradyrhizobium]MCP3464049.1 TRAP transporter substrate-binding protein [Bradyrhizobium sp. CCGUVB23]